MTPELQSQMAVWKQKCLDGTMTKEEYILAFRHLRGDRLSTQQASSKARKTAVPKATVDVADALAALEGLK